ncbi:hypothetical protein MELA_00836 [Candidatus Methylomirabilis lanthanidiphila]|uniref:Uncharacterized protein n=1 Tax=Candidatus Methylomirabilis lanthanidiphila TaxID=2211376 RepID=A0A564ZH34_9BACT|nr:hypothetical protein MELA_00836 [Candidatus Methylomirabilis lanthanidiphila]
MTTTATVVSPMPSNAPIVPANKVAHEALFLFRVA